MLLILFVVIVASVFISFLCSLMEAALFAVPVAHAKHYAEKNYGPAIILLRFKENLSRPVSAILILNTLAHTIGAAMSGAIVVQLYGQDSLMIFSIGYTIVVLLLSEILPKNLGAIYNRQISFAMAYPLNFLIYCLYPLIKISNLISASLKTKEVELSLTENEFISMTQIGTEEGVLDHLQGSVIKNIIGLDRLTIKDILTPRVVVFRLPEDTKLGEIRESIVDWSYSRVPIFATNDPEQITGYVMQRDLFRAFLHNKNESTLKEFARPLNVVPEQMRADKFLLQMFENREAICAVVDEHAGFAGIVTLEDVIEELVGREIVDEYDLVTDLRTYAQALYVSKMRKKVKQ